MGHATALMTMAQQLCFSLGVLFAVELLRASVWWRQGQSSQLQSSDFAPAFIAIAATVLLALPFFLRLPADVGVDLHDGPAR